MKILYSVTESRGRVTGISFSPSFASLKKDKNVLEKRCRAQIDEYLLGKRKTFSIPLQLDGTEFQMKVWKQMLKIPYGKTVSYKELAEKIRHPKAYRAVANACGKNKIPIIIPCHRVVAGNGLGGFSAGIKLKQMLLDLEKKLLK